MSETARWTGPAPPQQQQRSQQPSGQGDGANLADILERVLDKGIVIAGDIQVNLLDIELLTIKIRLVVASVERAKEMGIDWWERDPTLSAGRRELEDENKELRARIEALERNGHRAPGGRELASEEADEEPADVDEDPYDLDDVEDVDDVDAEVDEAEIEEAEIVDDLGDAEDDGGDADEPEGAPDDEPRTRSGGRSGRAARAKADPDEPPADDGPDDDGPARSRSTRGRGRAGRGPAGADGEKQEMPARRKPGSKRSSREG